MADAGVKARLAVALAELEAAAQDTPPVAEEPRLLNNLLTRMSLYVSVNGRARRPFVARPALDIDTFGVQSRDWLLEHDFIPPDLLPAWRSVADAALDGVRRCYDRAGDVSLLRLHGDCHASNVLWQLGNTRCLLPHSESTSKPVASALSCASHEGISPLHRAGPQ